MATETKKILVVEDEAPMRAVVVRRLAAHNFTIVEAGNGRQAMELWEKEKPDLVLLDLMLPEIDGFTVLETMRGHSDPQIAKARVLVLTNLWSQEDIDRTEKLGIDGYFVKAYLTTEEIAQKVEEALNK